MTPRTCSDLIEALAGAATVEEIHSLCCSLCEETGFDHFIYGARIPTSFVKPHFFIISGYPQEWRERYVEQGYLRIDPTVTYCACNILPFTWDKVSPLEREDAVVRKFMAESRDFGLKSGISFPIHTAQGESAMLSLASGEEQEEVHSRTLHAMPYVQLIALHIHEAVRRAVNTVGIGYGQVQLSGREKECLLWSAEGKTSWEIAQIIGVAERTVIFHLQNAADKLKVVNRQQAVARAISAGLISPQL